MPYALASDFPCITVFNAARIDVQRQARDANSATIVVRDSEGKHILSVETFSGHAGKEPLPIVKFYDDHRRKDT